MTLASTEEALCLSFAHALRASDSTGPVAGVAIDAFSGTGNDRKNHPQGDAPVEDPACHCVGYWKR
jgi:hypothetical protein